MKEQVERQGRPVVYYRIEGCPLPVKREKEIIWEDYIDHDCLGQAIVKVQTSKLKFNTHKVFLAIDDLVSRKFHRYHHRNGHSFQIRMSSSVDEKRLVYECSTLSATTIMYPIFRDGKLLGLTIDGYVNIAQVDARISSAQAFVYAALLNREKFSFNHQVDAEENNIVAYLFDPSIQRIEHFKEVIASLGHDFLKDIVEEVDEDWSVLYHSNKIPISDFWRAKAAKQGLQYDPEYFSKDLRLFQMKAENRINEQLKKHRIDLEGFRP